MILSNFTGERCDTKCSGLNKHSFINVSKIAQQPQIHLHLSKSSRIIAIRLNDNIC